ncbi:hypothetical protein HAX54_024464, partial [Datura stramonium]|nr:hypothetical protein [Datura stramonium]
TPEEGDDFCSRDKHLISKEADGQSNQHIAKGLGVDCLNEYLQLEQSINTPVNQSTIAQRAPQKDCFLTPDLIEHSVEEVNNEDPEPTTSLEEEHQVIPEAHTKFELAKSVQALNNKVREAVNPVEKEPSLVREAQTESHNVKSVEEVDKQVPEPFTPMEDEHPIVHEAHSYIKPGKSLQAVIDDAQKKQQVRAIDQVGMIVAVRD